MALVGEELYRVDADEAIRYFDYAGFRARDMREPLRRAGSKLLSHINRTFETEGEYVGDRWPELSNGPPGRNGGGYRTWKEHHYPGRPLLVLTGQLRRRATSRAAIRVAGDSVRYELHSPFYAGVHQYGESMTGVSHNGSTYSYSIPARPFVVVTPELIEEVREEFADWLDDLKRMNRSRRGLDLENPLR